jgi:hypothetical protein
MSDLSSIPAPDESDVVEKPETEISGNEVLTEMMAGIRIEGQSFELEADLAGDDELLKTVLRPHFSSVENAAITREVKNGRLEVSIVKKAQHKGCR